MRQPTWHCCAQRLPVSPELNRLVSVALIRISRWAAVSCCAVLCSPDVPPVRFFNACTSGGLTDFTEGIVADLSLINALYLEFSVLSQ